jgi:hypothetical protein
LPHESLTRVSLVEPLQSTGDGASGALFTLKENSKKYKTVSRRHDLNLREGNPNGGWASREHPNDWIMYRSPVICTYLFTPDLTISFYDDTSETVERAATQRSTDFTTVSFGQ